MSNCWQLAIKESEIRSDAKIDFVFITSCLFLFDSAKERTQKCNQTHFGKSSKSIADFAQSRLQLRIMEKIADMGMSH